MMDFKQFAAQVPTKAQAKSTFQVDQESAEIIEAFVTWLVEDQKMTKGSANSYRTYVTKPMSLGTMWEDMTSSERSGARKFAQYLATRED